MPGNREREDFLVVIATFHTPQQAHLARVLLETDGIDARLDGEHYNWMLGEINGGVKLYVRRTEIDAARAILASHAEACPNVPWYSGTINVDFPDPCPECASQQTRVRPAGWSQVILCVLLLGFPILFLRDRHQCDSCRHVW